MDKNIFHNEIESLLNRVSKRHETIKKMSAPIPKIEVDLLLADLRYLYEFCSELGNISLHEPAPVPEKMQQQENMAATDSFISQHVEEKKEVYIHEKIIAPPQTTHANPTNLFDELVTVGDSFEGKITTLNDKIIEKANEESVASRLKKQPIEDLRAAIGINEKFIFLNELFESNASEYAEAIESINNCNSLEEADHYLRSSFATKYNWNLKNKFVKGDFMDLVQRRFL